VVPVKLESLHLARRVILFDMPDWPRMFYNDGLAASRSGDIVFTMWHATDHSDFSKMSAGELLKVFWFGIIVPECNNVVNSIG